MEEIAALFNELGMQSVLDQGFVRDIPEEIAEFLHTNEALDLKKIGEFVAHTSPENRAAYVAYPNYGESDLLEALRILLASFSLPGEAQSIDRIMEAFATHYYELSVPGGPFANVDACYILCFSLIMLSTDLTSPHRQSKMTQMQFVRSNSGINNGDDIDSEYLRKIYTELQQNPFVSWETPYGRCKKRGYLETKGRLFFWKKLWFILTTNNLLFYFKNAIEGETNHAMGYIEVDSANIEPSQAKGKFLIEFTPKEGEEYVNRYQLGKNKPPQEEKLARIVLAAETMEDMENWCAALVDNFRTSKNARHLKSARK
mmetsp:Transcript_11033/g.13631  ORF Transcript_11033/g.13631 Transcript_11033/m.13631 type:complete len:315 (-) Transcript_11033:112-1056(-)|eukprot:CAMPEP_0206183432 /NCGR_PEP_ID=MMETSP0166-20121206/634_1 /ASSEMBLY_ACC=CAM_ASM_000260 /TAXON_ID=95228 /ORGANISM="Vannella robusta, Strain DIVA3 518/3/11/1/6" /LENGTH=314 /DNA_ID=CAMNT_0053598285 /DNA_START=83 /DNA_END=1027 /DNA_ORIENTATION=-